MEFFNQWDGFKEGKWIKEIDVRDFIQNNYIPYEGDSSFLAGTTGNCRIYRQHD
jgi:formate C-acetyltransferase